MLDADITIRVAATNDVERKSAVELLAKRAARAGLAAERVAGGVGIGSGLHVSGGSAAELRQFFEAARAAAAAAVTLTLD